MPNVTAFQKADRLALLVAIDSFFGLVGNSPVSEDATRVAFKIRRCQYEGSPADVKTLMSFLGWSKTKVLNHLKELEEVGFEFRTVKDPLDNRRSIQQLHGTETPDTTEFFDKCFTVVDVLVRAREAAKERHPVSADKIAPTAVPAVPQRAGVLCASRAMVKALVAPAREAVSTSLIPMAFIALLAGWMILDTDKIADLERLESFLFEHSLPEMIGDPSEHCWKHYEHERHPSPRVRETTVMFAQADYQRSDYAGM